MRLRFAFDVKFSVSCGEAQALSRTEIYHRSLHNRTERKKGPSQGTDVSFHFTGLQVLPDRWCQQLSKNIKFYPAQGDIYIYTHAESRRPKALTVFAGNHVKKKKEKTEESVKKG